MSYSGCKVVPRFGDHDAMSNTKVVTRESASALRPAGHSTRRATATRWAHRTRRCDRWRRRRSATTWRIDGLAMHGLLHLDRALDPVLRGVGQARRERLKPREVIGALRFGARQRGVTTRRGRQRGNAREHGLDARGRGEVLVRRRGDRVRAARRERLEVYEAAARLRHEWVEA